MTKIDKSPRQSHAETVVDVCLTARQQDILALLFEGFDNQAIAQRMVISIKTVENHLTRLYRQLNVESRSGAVSYARQNPEVLGGRAPNQPCAINSIRNPQNSTLLPQNSEIAETKIKNIMQH